MYRFCNDHYKRFFLDGNNKIINQWEKKHY